jgi:hypothetical protein
VLEAETMPASIPLGANHGTNATAKGVPSDGKGKLFLTLTPKRPSMLSSPIFAESR